ncbi:ent-kaurenoic acid oxidase 2-like [Gossypium raimondii]|uniref:ent-kaurenoic acid oxidase 2-like n=1 Tax=Gossypium raimondii TaxID=29730 RepID=UPI00063B05CD|nr:ent-kaurenoic acid oxidase 2-like [Gossypium raimondii]
MGIELLWSFVAIVAATYVTLFGFLKKINEWYYVTMSEKKQNPLPPGHMGWPFIGNMWSFFKASNSQDPDSFIDNLVKRYGRTSIYRTHLFGSPSVIVCSQELCRKVLTDDEHFSYGYPSSAIQLGGKKSLYGISNSEHRRLRRLRADPINGHQALALYISVGTLAPCKRREQYKEQRRKKQRTIYLLTNVQQGSNLLYPSDMLTHSI